MKIKMLFGLALLSLITACSNGKTHTSTEASSQNPDSIPTPKIILASEITWDKLNPARGDKSPMAGTVWGDRNGKSATGFLFKPIDGFKSPPHIHNVSYRGIVIKGVVHNDDPSADNMWMPTGSFWTQPKGAEHITSAKGDNIMAYIEIEEGPYLVRPIDKAFDSGERPVNVDVSNLVWLDASTTTWIEQIANKQSSLSPKITFLWESPQNKNLKGVMVKLPTGFKGKIENNGDDFRAVVIQGKVKYTVPNNKEVKTLDPGSYFSTTGKSYHSVASQGSKESLIYIRTNGKLKITTSIK